MFEKVNPQHPDKVADRIAGAIVDLAYNATTGNKQKDPKVAVEVLLGHGQCTCIIETSLSRGELRVADIEAAIKRISGDVEPRILLTAQDEKLAANQQDNVRCGDNGIFRGVPATIEQRQLTALAKAIYSKVPHDGKYVVADGRYIICQSNAGFEELVNMFENFADEYDLLHTSVRINPLGEWTGGPDVDSGATNRKLGSDMGDAVTGGGLHGKDLSKADVSVNIMCHLLAKEANQPVTAFCAIGDTSVRFTYQDGKKVKISYACIVEQAREYIKQCGGFEKFAEWGLV